MRIVEYLGLIPELMNRTLSHTFTSVQSWTVWCSVGNSNELSWRYITSCFAEVLKVPTRHQRGMLSQTFKWIQLLQSSDVRPYYSETEQVGLEANRTLNRGIIVDTGDMFTKFIGSRSLVLKQHGLRTSTIGGYYFGGGASLINHGCSKCANVIIDYKYGEVEIVENVLEGEPLYVVYDDDDNALFRDYGILCHCTLDEGEM